MSTIKLTPAGYRPENAHPLGLGFIAVADFLAPAISRLAEGVIRATTSVGEAVIAGHRKRVLYAELMALDDRMLADIGLTRTDIAAVVEGRFVRGK